MFTYHYRLFNDKQRISIGQIQLSLSRFDHDLHYTVIPSQNKRFKINLRCTIPTSLGNRIRRGTKEQSTVREWPDFL